MAFAGGARQQYHCNAESPVVRERSWGRISNTNFKLFSW
jgi:hypothetical protein